MNNSKQNGNDILWKYIYPGRIEKAPEGLTDKIMTRIQFERAPLRITGKSQLNILVPVISAMITLILIVLAIIFSSPSDSIILSGIMRYIPHLNITFPEIEMDTFSGFSLPAIMIYIVIVFFILTLFDIALNRLFYKHKK